MICTREYLPYCCYCCTALCETRNVVFFLYCAGLFVDLLFEVRKSERSYDFVFTVFLLSFVITFRYRILAAI